MASEVVCKSCGGKYPDDLSKCPYCSTLNIPAAEEEYMEKLEDVREDLEELEKVPQQEIDAAVGRLGKYIVKVLVIAVILALIGTLAVMGIGWWMDRGLVSQTEMTAEEYLWQEENFSKWNELHEQGKYIELIDAVHVAMQEDHVVWNWNHYGFYSMYSTIESAQAHIDTERTEGKLSDNSYSLLLHEQWTIKGMEIYKDFSEEELAFLRPLAEPVLVDFETRWDFTQEEYDAMYREFEEREGYVSFDTIDDFLKDWKKRQ